MTLDEFRCEMEAYRQAVHEEANEFKYPYLVLKRLSALYRKFDVEERAMADQVLVEWVLSEDSSMRFDARALIDDFRVIQAVPALQILAKRLESSRAVSAPAELEVTNRIIGDLTRG
jgi:hypothetical protein